MSVVVAVALIGVGVRPWWFRGRRGTLLRVVRWLWRGVVAALFRTRPYTRFLSFLVLLPLGVHTVSSAWLPALLVLSWRLLLFVPGRRCTRSFGRWFGWGSRFLPTTVTLSSVLSTTAAAGISASCFMSLLVRAVRSGCCWLSAFPLGLWTGVLLLLSHGACLVLTICTSAARRRARLPGRLSCFAVWKSLLRFFPGFSLTFIWWGWFPAWRTGGGHRWCWIFRSLDWRVISLVCRCVSWCCCGSVCRWWIWIRAGGCCRCWGSCRCWRARGGCRCFCPWRGPTGSSPPPSRMFAKRCWPRTLARSCGWRSGPRVCALPRIFRSPSFWPAHSTLWNRGGSRE